MALIDAMGGVPMPDGSVADGRKALSIARTRRGDPTGDLGRVRRQMALGRQITPAVRTAGSLRLLHILMLLPSAVRTDVGLVRGAALAYQVAERGITAAILPGTPEGMRYLPTRDARRLARRYLLQTAPAGPGTNGG